MVAAAAPPSEQILVEKRDMNDNFSNIELREVRFLQNMRQRFSYASEYKDVVMDMVTAGLISREAADKVLKACRSNVRPKKSIRETPKKSVKRNIPRPEVPVYGGCDSPPHC